MEGTFSTSSQTAEYHEENECQPQKLVDDEEGTNVQERGIQLGRPPGVTSSTISIRRLLCDNAACALCERTAMEAAEVVRIQQTAPRIPPLPQPPLPATSYVERASLAAVCALRDSAPFPPVSCGEPEASCSVWKTPLSHEELGEKPSHLPTRTTLVCRLWGKSPRPQSQPSHKDAHSDNSEDTADQEEEEEEEEHFLISSAGTSMQALTSGEESSPSSCLTRYSSWKDQTHCRHHKTFFHQQGRKQASWWSDSESSSESQGKAHWDNSILQTQRRSRLSSSREASAVTSSGTLQSPRSPFAAEETPFVSDATRETLEWHMAVKRVQHGLGLPSLYLRSLRAFQPLAPNPTFQTTPESEVTVVTGCQGPFFLSMKVRSQLERHLKEMIHLKRWGLPRKVQRALGHLKLDSQPPVWRKQHAFRNMGRARQNGRRASQHSQHEQHIASAPCGNIVSKHPPNFQTKLQIHVGKKSLEIGQEALPKRVRDSQKITDPEERKSPLQKVIPPYKSHAQRRNGPSLRLWGKADGVDMNTKRKYIQFLWGLPTTHTHSLTKVKISSLEVPLAPLKVHPTIKFGEAETSFLPHSVRQYLEMHVIRKKIQHHWGESRLMQQSVDKFLPATPAATAPHSFPTTSLQVEMKVLVKSSLPFISLEDKRQLENHIKSKIIERRWGLPKRVMESLRKLSPSLIKKPSDSQETSVSLQEKKVLKKPPSKEVPYLFGKVDVKDNKYSALRRHIAKKAIEIHMGKGDSVFHLFQATDSQRRKQHGLPKIIPLGLKAKQPRSQELAFVEEAALMRTEFSIIHKNVTARFGLPTLYRDSLSCLFRDVTFWPRCPLKPSKGTKIEFTSTEITFLGQGAQAELEWHVRRKRLQHTWGMPLLIQKSLRCLFPTVPSMKTPGHMDVTVLPAQLSFLSHTIIQELEKNVAKRNICQQWRLPRRVLGSARLLGPEMVRGKTPDDGSEKPMAMATSSPGQPPVLLKLQPDVLQKMMFHLSKKCMEVSLGATPALARFSWQCVLLSLKEPLPKLIPSGHRILQKRCRFLPFGHPEDLDHIELSLRRNHLKSLWGLGSHYTEVVRRLMPRAPSLPSRASGFPCSEEKLPFLQEQEREDLELHIKRKRLEHMWDFSALVQRSLGGFVGQTRFLFTHWKTPMVQIHVQCQELSFLSQGTQSYLEFHIQRMKQRHQWGLPRRVMESLKAMSPASAAGWRQPPHFLPPSTQTKDGDGTKRELQERGTDLDFSETQMPFLSHKEREGLELHLKKKRMQHEWSLPSLVRRSLESFMPRTPPLHRLQKARMHIQPKTEELFFLPAGVCIYLEQHIQRMKHRQRWHLPKRILQSLRPLGWELEAGIPGDERTRVPHLLAERSHEKPPESLDGRRTEVSPAPEAHFLLTLNPEAQQKMRLLILRKCVEIKTAAFPTLVKQSWHSVSSRQPLPKHVGPRAPPGLRSNFLPFVWREELRQIELAVLRNHFASLWELGRSYVEATTALMSKLTLKPLRFRDVQVEFLEVQTPFLQEQYRECLEQHVRRKRLEHAWGLPALVLKSISGCIHSAPPEPNPRKTEIQICVLQQEPSFLPQSICRHLEFHLQRRQVQRQWRLPQRVLESTRIFLCPESGTHSSGMTRTWATSKLPVGVGLPELGQDKNFVSKMVPKLQFHLAKKSTEVQLEAVPGVVRHSWPQATLFSKQQLPKVLHAGSVLQRNSSFPFFHSGEAALIDMSIRRTHLASLWGSGTHYVESMSGKTECKPFSEHGRLRWTRIEFLEAQTPFLQKHNRELLEAHITKKKIHHNWGFPILVQKSLKAFLQETPQLPLPKKTTVNVHILRQDPLFLPQKISSHLEFHIQKRNVQRQWGLPKQVLASLKIFFPVRKAPLSFSKDLGDESVERGKEERGQRQRTVVDAFSLEQKHAMQKHFERKHLQVLQEMEPKVVRQSQEKASGLGEEPGQKWLPNRAETSAFLTPSTTDDLEPSALYKQWTSEWGLTGKSLEPPSKFVSMTHDLIPTRKWSACIQKVETPSLQNEQREALEYHIKKKRLQHEWDLPRVVQQSVRAFAPTLPMPTCPLKGRGQEVRILIEKPSFLPAPLRKALEDSLKRRIICRQWGLLKRIRKSLRMLSPRVGEALRAARELHETVPVEEDMRLSVGNQQATGEMKEPTEEVGVSGSQGGQTRRPGSLTSERPKTLKQQSFSTGQSEMEGMAITSKTPPTTKEVSIGGLQAMENIACEMPEATEEVAFVDESPGDEVDGPDIFSSLETSLGMEATSETALGADEISSVTQIIPGAGASLASSGQSPFPMQHSVEGPPPTNKVSNGGKMSPSVEDAISLHGSLHKAMEKNLLISSVEKSQQLATEGGNVADHSKAMEEENIPWQKSLPTIEEENSTGSQFPQSTDEVNGPRSPSAQAIGEDSILQTQTSPSIEEEKSQEAKSLQSGEEETSLEPQTSQSAEEENNAEPQSMEATEEENSSRLYSSHPAAAEEEEDSSLGSQNSLVLNVVNASGLLSLQATEDGDSWNPGATGGRNSPDKSTVTAGAVHIPSGCPLGREKELVKDKTFMAEQESLVSGEPPETVNTLQGGTQAGRGTLQDTEGTSTPLNEIPWAAPSLQHPMTGPMRSKALTSGSGSPPKHTTEPLGAQFPPSHFPSHGGCKSVRGGQSQAPAKASLDPTSDLHKTPPACKSELKLWMGHGGRIVSWVSPETPPFSTSLEPPPSMDGGSWEISTKRRMAGTPLPQHRAVPSQPAQNYGVHSFLQKVEELSEGSEPLPECSAGDRDPQLTATSSTETLAWDKGKTSQQPESSLRLMVPKRPHSLEFPRYSQQPYSPHPAGGREPPSADRSPVISSPCMCHTAAYQRGLAFPGERDDSQERYPVSSAESATDVMLTRPEGTQENLPRPSDTAEHHLFQESDVTQQALKSSRLPPHVISSCSGNKETLPGMTRQADKWCWERRHRLPHQGSACLRDEGEGTPVQIQERRDHFVDGRWGRCVAGHAGETREWISESLSEVSLGEEHASADLSMNGVFVEKKGHESTWAIEEHQKTSGASFEDSGKISQPLSPLGFSLDDLPAPPSLWFRSEAEDGAAKRGFKSHLDSHIMVGKSAPQLPLNLLEECHMPVDSQDQFSTECEWERIGDWDSNQVQTTSRASSANEEVVHNLWERATGGCCSKTMPFFGSQGQDASCSTGQDADNIVCLIGTVLERKLSLNHGMHVWLQSQSRGNVARCEKCREGAPAVASREEEMQEVKPLRVAFGAEPAVEGLVSERRGKLVQMDEVAHQPTGAPFPRTGPFQTGRRGPTGRPGISTSPDSTQMTPKGSRIENHGAVRPDGKLPKEICLSKSSAMKLGTEEVKRQEAHHLGRPAERRHGSQKGAPESREREMGGKEERFSKSQGKRLKREMHGFSSEPWRPIGSQGTPQTRAGRSQRRGESTVRARVKDQWSPLDKETNTEQDDVSVLIGRQTQTTVRTSQRSSTFFKSFFLKLLHRQDQQTTVGNGHRGQEVGPAAQGRELPTAPHRGRASTAALCGRPVPHP